MTEIAIAAAGRPGPGSPHPSGPHVSAVPPGFAPIGPTSPFNGLAGPFYIKRDGGTFVIGMVVEPKHQNSRGIVHGGMICTLIDFALGYAARYATDPPRNLVRRTCRSISP
jgi:acyl-coenzyme A thioesterase PaaI-like protein